MIVREATRDDVPTIVDITNDVAATSDAIWRDEPVTLVDRLGWLRDLQDDGFPVLVAQLEADEVPEDVVDDNATEGAGAAPGTVVGYGMFGNFRTLSGYSCSVEHSIHLAAGHRGRGIGQLLLDALTARAEAMGKAVMVAGLDAGNDGSYRFHQRNGFREVARLPGIGRKQGRPVDLVLMQKDLS